MPMTSISRYIERCKVLIIRNIKGKEISTLGSRSIRTWTENVIIHCLE